MVATSYRLADVLGILFAINKVEPGKQAAFRAKVKHLQRLGCPGETNTGTGSAATYSDTALVRLTLAMHLMRAGIRPERAAALIAVALIDELLLPPTDFLVLSSIEGAQLEALSSAALVDRLHVARADDAGMTIINLRTVLAELARAMEGECALAPPPG